MAYCHTSAQIDRYLDEVGSYESDAEVFYESDRYDKCVDKFIETSAERGEVVTADDYPDSFDFINDLDEFIQGLIDSSI